MRILLVEGDETLRSLLIRCLRAENYAVDAVRDGQQAKDYVLAYDYDLLILAVELPLLDGITLCKMFRSEEYMIPIMLLATQNNRSARLTGWNAGADDYVVKPLDEEEFVARVRALLRRNSANPLPTLTWGPLWLDTNTCDVSYDGQLLSLTVKEYTLLEMMLRDSQHVFSNEDIIEGLWASEEFPTEATVRSHVRRLRQKLSAAGAPSDLIATSYGRGYYLKPVDGANTPDAYESDFTLSQATLAQVEPGCSSDLSRPLISSPTINLLSASSPRLSQHWNPIQGDCLQRVAQLRGAIAQIETNPLSSLKGSVQIEAYQIAHTLCDMLATLGVNLLGLNNAIALIRQIEQELHPDIHVDPIQATTLHQALTALEQEIQTVLIEVELGAREEQLGRGNGPPPSLFASPIRALLVDDDPIFLQMMCNQLRGHGVEAVTLDAPQQFWTVLNNIVPEVLILDVIMPYLNGLELCQKLRLIPEWQKLPVIFLSILEDTETQHCAFAVGADDYLVKPVTAKFLSDRIRQRLQRIQVLLG